MPGQEYGFYSEGTGEPMKAFKQRSYMINVIIGKPMAHSRWLLGPAQAPTLPVLGEAPDLAVSEP